MDWEKQECQRLIQSILALKTTDEAQNFLRDLMTAGEIAEFSKRLQAAEMLMQKIPYKTIEQQTSLSSATIARVAKWLNSAGGGYKIIIKRLHHTNTIE